MFLQRWHEQKQYKPHTIKLFFEYIRNKSSYFISIPIHTTFENNIYLDFFSGKMLTQLDVSQNSLTQVPSAAFKNLHHLLILNMNHNKISSLHEKAFQGLDTLEILTLYENKINNIDANAFVGLEK